MAYTLARKYYTHKCLFSEFISRKMTSVTRKYFSGINYPKITYHVFVCDSENYTEKLFGELFSLKISFQLHEMMFSLQFRVPGMELKNPSSPEIRKTYEKVTESPTPSRAPKIRKKNTKNTKKGIFRPFSYFFCIFVRIFGRGGGFRDFFVFFSYFRA